MTVHTDTPGTVTTLYKVSGMSCGHCVALVFANTDSGEGAFTVDGNEGDRLQDGQSEKDPAEPIGYVHDAHCIARRDPRNEDL